MHDIRKAVNENTLSDDNALGHGEYVPFLGLHGETWIGAFDGVMAGFGAIDRRNASVWALFVSPQFEAQGIGKTLLAKLVDRAKFLGLAGLHLTTTAGTRAEKFYIRQGWVYDGHAPREEVRLRLTFEQCIKKGG